MVKKLDATPLYRKIIADAWHIAWGHKHIWFFAFFATFIGFGGISEVFFGTFEKSSNVLLGGNTNLTAAYFLPGLSSIRTLIQFSPNPLISVLVFTLIMGLLIVVFAWIITVSIGALIASVRKIAKGKDMRLPDAMKVGAEKFWPVFGVNAMAKIVVGTSFFLIGTNLVYTTPNSPLSTLLYIVSFILFTAIAVIVSLVAIFSTNFVVLKDERLTGALDKGWMLLRKHWLICIEMTLVLFVASILLGITALLGALVASVPIIFLILLTLTIGLQNIAFIIITFGMGIALIALTLLASLITSFQVASWTILWEELLDKRRLPHLHHIIARLYK